MKRLLDRMLSRWYVPRAYFDLMEARYFDAVREPYMTRGGGVAIRSESSHIEALTEGPTATMPQGTVLITTDYKRGTPCS